MKKHLEVKFGSIYTTSGELNMIDNIGVVLNKDYGFSKYGSLDTIGKMNIRDYYNKTVEKYKDSGLEDEANNLILVEFDRYEGILSIEEICTLCNYMISACPSFETIWGILTMSETDIHGKVSELSTFGY